MWGVLERTDPIFFGLWERGASACERKHKNAPKTRAKAPRYLESFRGFLTKWLQLPGEVQALVVTPGVPGRPVAGKRMESHGMNSAARESSES